MQDLTPNGGPKLTVDPVSLHAALEKLSPALREAVVLRYVVHLDNSSAAKAMGISLTTARTRTYRGMRRLRETVNGRPEAQTKGGSTAELEAALGRLKAESLSKGATRTDLDGTVMQLLEASIKQFGPLYERLAQ